MKLRDCPFCGKPIPARMTACPYCHTDEEGKPVAMDTAPAATEPVNVEKDLAELSSEDAWTRDQATVRLAQKGFGVTQALIAVLGDLAKPGLPATAKVLGRIGDRRAVPPLIQAVKSTNDELRVAALWALAQFRGEPQALSALIAEADRPHPVTQSYLAHALGGFQDPAVVPALVRLAASAKTDVAYHAALSLGEWQTPEAVKALKRTLARRDRLLRAAAASSLQRLGVRVSFLVRLGPASLWVVLMASAAAAMWLWTFYR